MNLRLSLTLLAAAVASGALAGYWLAAEHAPAPAGDAQRQVLYWYDPMVPGQRFDRPGKSPFMDMQLVPRYADGAAQEEGVTISARQQQNLGVRTEQAQMRVLEAPLIAVGRIATDERGVQVIAARANAQIEKLYVRANQQRVQQGQPLAQLWIPEWSAAQQEYLAVRQLGDRPLTAAARQRLQLVFMPEAVIRQVERSGKPQPRVTLNAPASGFINQLSVREGQQVAVGQALFELAALDPVWLVIDYPQGAQVRPGDAVQASAASWPGEHFNGRISELLPNVDPQTRTAQARVELANPQQKLQPGMFLQATLSPAGQRQPVLAVPQEALISRSDRTTVLLAESDGHFTPADVVAGRVQGGWAEIKQGLQAGQRVVTSGQFLIDSEASMRSVLPQLAGETAPAAQYQAEATIVALADGAITLAHGPVPALQWPAMTMDFALPPGGLPAGLAVGSKVRFFFSVDDNGPHISRIMPQAAEHGGHL